ncbi:MAG: WD40 repeat domain-containing protein [Alphaproteobacteria bacterium]|nr:WD40 repeat domain-containing protein [Alphaproteobacteria bacterium]
MTMVAERNGGALFDSVGVVRSFGAHVVALVFTGDDAVAAALGDGHVVFAPTASDGTPRRVRAHDGVCLTMRSDIEPGRLLSGGDDGRLASVGVDGSVRDLVAVPGAWVDPIATAPATHLRAAAIGRSVILLGSDGSRLATFEHDHTVAGLTFDPKGRRLAASSYGGTFLWWANVEPQTPKRLRWPGSHLETVWSPDGRFVVSAMQENALHGWRLADRADMRMAGYSVKVRSMAWLSKGRYLATGGSEGVVCWPFHGKDGPMGKSPLDLGWGLDALVTVVAPHPCHDLVAAGYEDGTTILAFLDRAIPVLVHRGGEGAVSALAWSDDGRRFAIGTEGGLLAVARLEDWRAPRRRTD